MFRGRSKRNGRRRLTPVEPAPDLSRVRPQPLENTGRLRPGQARPRETSASDLASQIIRRAGLLILTLAVLASLVNVLSLSSHTKIEPLTSSGNPSGSSDKAFLRENAVYQAAADKLMAGSLWNRNKITINTGRISRQLMAQFPELASADVTLPLFSHRPVVYVRPAQATLVIAANDGAYVIDQNGRALLLGANLPTASKLPQIIDQSGLRISLGHQVLTSDDVSFIQTVLAELAAKHVQVASMVLPPASRELDVFVAHQLYFVKFNLANNDARQQAGTYLATIAELNRRHIKPAHYIDVRVDGRAYYR